MDFKKFSSSIGSSPSPGYIALKGFRGEFRGYELTSVKMEDSDPIMKWRNDQMSALRQSAPLTQIEQKAYFDNWGNRCYIPLIDEKCENIDLNERGLIDMNCKYLFSKLELKKTNFKLVKRFRNQSCRFNEIFVYQIF